MGYPTGMRVRHSARSERIINASLTAEKNVNVSHICAAAFRTKGASRMGEFPNDWNFEVKLGDVGPARKRALDAQPILPRLPQHPMGTPAVPWTGKLPRPITRFLVAVLLLYLGYNVTSRVYGAITDFRRGGITGTDVVLLYCVATLMLLIGIAAAMKALFGSAKRHPFLALLCIAAPLAFGSFARTAGRAASRASTQNIAPASQTAPGPTTAVKRRARKKPAGRRLKSVAAAPLPSVSNPDGTQEP